ncbi:MAG TPA: hypothetical protein DD979_04165 [Gammaproteobacteria bacterium]|nr:hypothetical protein [Gammaproteobacteria bacterium]
MLRSTASRRWPEGALPRRLPPLGFWRHDMPVGAQMALAVALGAACVVISMIALPLASFDAAQRATTFYHESSHATLSYLFNGDWLPIHLDVEGGGHAMVLPMGSASRIVIALAGMIGPAILAAALLGFGLTRVLTSTLLGAVGASTAIVTVFLTTAPGSAVVMLYSLAATMILLALLPPGGLIKSAGCLFLGAWLTWGVFNGIGYADVEWIDPQQTQPSDAKIVALELGYGDLGDVPDLIKLLISCFYFLSAFLTLAWWMRHR